MGLSDNTLEDPGKIRSVVDILTQAKCPIVVKMSQESQDADSPKVIDLYAGQPFRQLRLVVTAQTIQGIVVQYLDQEFDSTNGKRRQRVFLPHVKASPHQAVCGNCGFGSFYNFKFIFSLLLH